MVRTLFLGLFLSLAFSGNAYAEPLTLDLASDQVDITTGFTGSELVVFGTKNGRGEVVVVLEGPRGDVRVRKKERVLGAWVNKASLEFEDMFGYYDFATTGEDDSALLSEDIRKERNIGFVALKKPARKKRYDDDKIEHFQDALIEKKRAQGFYPDAAESVTMLGDGLFRVDFKLPANITPGEYTVRGLLVNNGQVVYEQSNSLSIGLTGFGAKIYKFALNYSFFYGILCVFLACLAGWASNMLRGRN
ncbi:MAG: TIGR02186 family protein [Pseudomonadota bacterium]